jgi:xylulokinase
MFFNIRLETGKTEMIRAVVEGVCYHLRWMLECEDKKVNTSETIRFCGGGALSPATSQILADITGRRIETVPEPQNAGSVGAAITAAVGLGEAGSIEELSEMVKPDQVFEPRNEYRELHDRNFDTFKKLYVSNKKNYAALNG